MPRIATVAAGTPFRERFVAGLGYPLRGGGLATCVALSIAHYLAMLPAFIGLFASFALWGATWRYGATCMLHTANGYADPPDVGVDDHPSAGNGMLAIHMLAAALCVLSALLYPPALWPLIVLFAWTLPAIDMSLAFDGSLELALSPVNWWEVMRRFGVSYFIPVSLNLPTGALIVLASLATDALPRLVSLPLFAFANAGLALGGLQASDVLASLPLGIVAGLVLGKPVGIVGAAWAMRSFGGVRWPDGMDGRAMLGLGLLCGIGFTMSLFIASLAYTDVRYEEAVLGVLAASVIAAILGMLWLRAVLPREQAGAR